MAKSFLSQALSPAGILRAAAFAGAIVFTSCAPHTPAAHAITDGLVSQTLSPLERAPASSPLLVTFVASLASEAAETMSEAAPTPVASIPAAVRRLMPASAAPYVPMIEAAATRYGLPAELLTAALSRESANFRERYIHGWHVDGTGRGMAGIDKVFHPEVSDEQAFDPEYAINWMARELSELIAKHDGDAYSAVREYNGGPRFDSDRIGWGGTPVSVLTRRHADAIFAYASGTAI